MPKKIISVGVKLASSDVEYACLRSSKSLLDWDVVIFRPKLSTFISSYSYDYYMGKKCLDDSYSIDLQESIQHWRRQIEDAVKEGKTVFVFLTEPEEVYIATGEKKYSGTGKNRQTTRVVTDANNFRFVPIHSGWHPAEGSEMRVSPSHRPLLGSYWEKFAESSKYYVVWEENSARACIHTKSGSRPVSFFFHTSESGGSLILLPDLNFEDEDFTEFNEGKEEVWTEEGIRFANSLTFELVEIAKAAASDSQKSATPEWSSNPEFLLPREISVRDSILEIDKEIQKLQADKDRELDTLNEITSLKDLLFESGRPLEFAIIRALRILGFEAENFDDGKSEFDVVFACPEGRLLGEAEGKEHKQVNITKLRQLSTNILEDVDREDVSEPAKGVLFGNAFRFQNPSEREDCFTKKCVMTSKATSIALVDTCKLFKAARYQLIHKNDDFARDVRQRMLTTNGLVEFCLPDVETEAHSEQVVKEEDTEAA